MELVFVCPVKNRDFQTLRWNIAESLITVSDPEKGKMIKGMVEAFCPYCSELHGYKPEDIPCPVTRVTGG